jgi:APA family basic amino acid/polyamine antiporter
MATSSPAQLVRGIGRWSLVALVINAVIGGGIFSVPTVAASLVGSGAALAWLIGGVANGFVMACYAEVASRFSVAGGSYIFARAALGRFVGIQVGWLSWLVRIASSAAIASVFITYLTEYFPPATHLAVRAAVLALLLGSLAVANALGVRSGAAVSNVFTISKLVPLLLFAAIGGVLALVHGPAAAAPMPKLAHAQWAKAILLMGYAFGGFDGAMMPLGEARNPRRDAPFALLFSLFALLALFTTIQVVTTYWLGIPTTERPVADAARRFLGGAGALMISAGALISTFGCLSANALSAPRVTFALAENSDFPPIFGRVHPRFHTPYVSVVLFAVAVWAFASFGGFRWNAFLSAAGRLLVYGSVSLALIVLRRQTDAPPATLRLPLGDLIAGVSLLICLLLLTQMTAGDLLVLVLTALLAGVTWFFARRGQRHHASAAQLHS